MVARLATKPSVRKAKATDFVVGDNVRKLLAEAGLTLSDLSAALGISHQQLQKYETGANRISAGMLFDLARFFARPVDALFEGSDDPTNEDTKLVRTRRKFHAIVDRTVSREKLELMAKVMSSISRD